MTKMSVFLVWNEITGTPYYEYLGMGEYVLRYKDAKIVERRTLYSHDTSKATISKAQAYIDKEKEDGDTRNMCVKLIAWEDRHE